MKTNKDKLVIQSISGNIHPSTGGTYYVGYDGMVNTDANLYTTAKQGY